MSSPTELYLPQAFPYPIKAVSLDVTLNASISRGTRLLSYSFVYTPSTPGAKPETRFGTWDSATDGQVTAWKIKQGEIISSRRARESPVILVTEPCKHGVQIGGLCGLCGKDMTDYDYTGYSDASRASIQMTHSAFGPTVSLEEAQRIEQETAEHLFKSRKLSLIVDLDQTIVHATVDPTVGEWISEGEAWQARQVKRAEAAVSKSKGEEGDSDEDDEDTSSESGDECNPNWEALKDVKKFRLGPESFGAAILPGPSKGKQKQIEHEGCMYYIKPRPGWKNFLQGAAKLYEMHVYTMGTRAYAEEVCSAIDPDSKLFGNRLLSRDESGSLTQKSLQRLFPCDTSMVVIIDDRADVWDWSPNLIKVIPYDFFVGIGDINSAFLPRVEPLAPGVSRPLTIGRAPSPSSSASQSGTSGPSSLNNPSLEEADAAERAANVLLTQNNLALEAQLEQRPLAKKQEELEEAQARRTGSTTPEVRDATEGVRLTPKPEKPKEVILNALLKNDDTELMRLSKMLDEVHTRFYAAYDSRHDHKSMKRPSGPSGSREPHRTSYDVTQIIPQMRSEVFAGVHILFSSVIPLDTRPETADVWRLAHMFGATCYTELNNNITHVVAAKRGTVKVDAARRRGSIMIVWPTWFNDSIALWRRQDETSYLLDDPAPIVGPSSSPIAEYHQISSDPDPDTDDWDEKDDGAGGSDKGFSNEINWADINDEVEAAMNESDDDDTKSDRSGLMSGHASDDEGVQTDEDGGVTRPDYASRLKRKRLRSVSPSPSVGRETGVNGGSNPANLRSPLAKRKKLAADRSYSKLKVAISADDLEKGGKKHEEAASGSHESPTGQEGEEEDDNDEDADDEEEEDDFLAREMEEELG